MNEYSLAKVQFFILFFFMVRKKVFPALGAKFLIFHAVTQ